MTAMGFSELQMGVVYDINNIYHSACITSRFLFQLPFSFNFSYFYKRSHILFIY